MADEPTSEKRLGAVLFYGVVAILAYLVYLIFEPFLAPLAWAGVLVVLFYPWHQRLERRWGKTWAAAASTAGVTLILIVPVLFVMTAFVRQGIEAARSVQQSLTTGEFSWMNRLWEWIVQRVPVESQADVATLAKQLGERTASFLATELGWVLRNVIHVFFDLLVTILAMFYFFRDGAEIMDGLRQVLPFEEAHRNRMITESHNLIFASVTSSLLAAAVHGLVGGLGFKIVGLHAALFWGVVMAFFSFLPLVGSAIIWVPASIILVLQGHAGRGLLLVTFCALIVSTMDNVIRPWLISGRARLSGLIIFISVLGGIIVFGMLGVVLGPIVVATAASVLELYERRGQLPGSGTSGAKPVGSERAPVLE